MKTSFEMKPLIVLATLLVSQSSIAEGDLFFTQNQHTNVSTHVSVDAVDERIGDIEVAKYTKELVILEAKEKAERWISYSDTYGSLKANGPYFPHLTNVPYADEIFQEAKDSEATPTKSVAKTLKNWDNHSF